VADLVLHVGPERLRLAVLVTGQHLDHVAGQQVLQRTHLQVGPLERLLTGQVVKLLVRHEGREPEPFWAEVEDQVGHLVTTTWSSTSAMVEISGLGVTKASTLEMLCAERGVAAEEVVAFGDMPNDLPMLAWAGTSYAMANAHSSVRELAGDTAPGNDEDGVAVVLERLFGL
jgi:hydroxymethylpyrimidine pyrophosphatase-like HAD family hydrolase